MTLHHTRHDRGFTLIELLVVIAIIGILSAVVLASLNTARTKARDAQRISNIKSLETAMELYYSDHGTYPQVGAAGAGHPLSQLASFLVPNDIGAIPDDPTSGISTYYVWGSPGTSYGIRVYQESLGSYCKTGVNINVGWWGTTVPVCNF